MIKASYSIPMNGNIFFDDTIQFELANILGEQIAMGIDQEITRALISDMVRSQRLENDKDITEMNEEEIQTHISDIFGVFNDV